MIFFKHKDVEYSLHWKYSKKTVINTDKKTRKVTITISNVIITQAFLIGSKFGKVVSMHTSDAVCVPEDNFSKNEGRFITLNKISNTIADPSLSTAMFKAYNER